MKKMIFLILLLSMTALAGCSKDTNSLNTSILNDFESREDIIFNTYNGFFGKIALNEDKKYVTSKDKSLKLTPVGDLVDQSNIPVVKFNVKDDLKDISNYSHLRFDAYNDYLEAVTIEISYTFSNNEGILMETATSKVKLLPSVMNKVLLPIDAKSMSLIYDVDNLKTVNFKFNRYIDNNSPDIYIDQLSFIHSDKKFVEEQIVLNENEIVSFERDYQANAFLAAGYGAVTGITPLLTINRNPDYSKEGNSLKVVAPRGTLKEGSWPYIELSPKIINQIDFASLNDNDEIAFDIYNNGSITVLFSIDFHSKDLKNDRKTTVAVKAQQWTSFKISIKDLNSTSDPKNLLMDSFGILRICYGEFADRDSHEFYFDSFRIIRND